MSQRYPDASCLAWAWRIDSGCRLSDGGEPTGTAGQPIYRAIEGQGLDHLVVGVIRYFGGTLLGAGGLMRAHGGTAGGALCRARRREEWPCVKIEPARFAAATAIRKQEPTRNGNYSGPREPARIFCLNRRRGSG